jgi:hypothetical protein
MAFNKWFFNKYKIWSSDKKGNAASITQFAKLFGATHQICSDWMDEENPKIPTSQKYINALFDVYGYEAYQELGISVPGLSPENSLLLLEASKDLNRSTKELGIDIDDPAFVKLFTEVFSRFGIKVKIID